jgi:quinoprotein glucose dehydrogenase
MVNTLLASNRIRMHGIKEGGPMSRTCRLLLFAPLLTAVAAAAQRPGPDTAWPAYGGDVYGTRHSSLRQITRDNVARLQIAWTYHTGELAPAFATRRETSLEVTPIVVDGTMFVSTPLGRVIALDPSTGQERWVFDPKIDRTIEYGDFANRGVATWLDSAAAPGAPCRRRIYIAVIDGRLIALDAASGRPCDDFGDRGVVLLKTTLRIPPFEPSAYEVTSPPVVVNGLVITGSAVADNSNPGPASGEVQAFDARTGAARWRWDPIPQDPADPAYDTWRDGSAARTGAANAWSVLAADPARDLVFVPTSSPAPDYFGGLRKGSNRYANSVVALRASTGAVVWDFQTVHHDLWDYDNAAPPALVTITWRGAPVPAVIQTNKTSMLFVLHRETGKPLFPVEERPVPASTVPEEEAWPTQPFTTAIGPLSPHRFTAADAWGATPEDRAVCREIMQGLESGGIYTPPSLQGTLVVPGNIGGAHWGGVAVDPGRQIAVVPVNRIAAVVQLIPAKGFDRAEARRQIERWDFQYTHMEGTPYIMRRRILLSPGGLPCTPPPFGALVAVSLGTGRTLWSVPLGTMAPKGATPAEWGSANLGGPITTAGGLVFIGATLDRAVRAFDIETGKELWKAELVAGARATPMTYSHGGRQFVVIAAGGGGRFGKGDEIVAFALPVR